jgi:glycosyltransferase involved in cell wall biosynthesis
MKLHFLLAKDLFRGGGIETYTREAGRRLAARGHNVTVYSTRGEGACPDEWAGMRIIWLPRVKPHWAEKSWGAIAAVYRALKQETPDVIHLHSVVVGSMASVLRLTGAPCIVQMHGIEWMRTRWGFAAKSLLKGMERASLASANAVTAVSNTQCDYFQHQYGASCEYIPTAADVKAFAPAKLILDLGVQPGEYILFAARLVPEKGAHYLIQAFRRLSTSQKLIIAGEAPNGSGYGQKLAALAGGDERIRFTGRVQGRLLEELFSNATLFAQPSELEGLSIGLIEAMSFGTPCIASNIPENCEVVGKASLLFQNMNVDDLSRQLEWALANPEAVAVLGTEGRKRVQALFCWDRVVDQLEELYHRVALPVENREQQLVVRKRAIQNQSYLS